MIFSDWLHSSFVSETYNDHFEWVDGLIRHLYDVIRRLNLTLFAGSVSGRALTMSYQGYISQIQDGRHSDPRLEDVLRRFKAKIEEDQKNPHYNANTQRAIGQLLTVINHYSKKYNTSTIHHVQNTHNPQNLTTV